MVPRERAALKSLSSPDISPVSGWYIAHTQPVPSVRSQYLASVILGQKPPSTCRSKYSALFILSWLFFCLFGLGVTDPSANEPVSR